MTLRSDAQRGIDAKAVLDNVAFKEAMELLKSSVIDQWKACPIRDREGQLLLLQLARLADKFEGLLVGTVERGKLAQRKIELDELRDEGPARRFFRRVA